MPSSGLFGLAVLAFAFVGFLQYHLRREWDRQVDADFEAALQRLHVEGFELLSQRKRYPAGNSRAEVYRVLRSDDDRYFFYLYIPGTPGVMQPLSRERALLAAKVNG